MREGRDRVGAPSAGCPGARGRVAGTLGCRLQDRSRGSFRRVVNLDTHVGLGNGLWWPLMARRNADHALALALAGGKTLRDAAAAVGVGERTVRRRWADQAFRRRVSELQQEMVGRCLGRMTDGMV